MKYEKRFKPSYTSDREDVLKLVPKGVVKVLDIGCSTGSLGRRIKQEIENSSVFGVDMHNDMAAEANKYLDRVDIQDLDHVNFEHMYGKDYFDCIVAADILEHLNNPWQVLSNSLKTLRVGGYFVLSLPNVAHISTFVSLLRKEWPYRDRGIHDSTHLRFFAMKNIISMMAENKLDIVRIKRNLRLRESPHWINKISVLLNFWPLRDFMTFQYLVLAKKLG